MNKKERIEIYQKAINKWGGESQVEMLLEECIELALATRKHLRNNQRETFENLAEEIADVEIMIEQVKLLFASYDLEPKVESNKNQKLVRLEKRIDN